MVVPSKFFGALSAGRPILFAGIRESALGQWIEAHRVGWVLTEDTIEHVADQLIHYAASAEEQKRMREHCFRIYVQYFSKRRQLEEWHTLLQSVIVCG
jgi:hypothetical protein